MDPVRRGEMIFVFGGNEGGAGEAANPTYVAEWYRAGSTPMSTHNEALAARLEQRYCPEGSTALREGDFKAPDSVRKACDAPSTPLAGDEGNEGVVEKV